MLEEEGERTGGEGFRLTKTRGILHQAHAVLPKILERGFSKDCQPAAEWAQMDAVKLRRGTLTPLIKRVKDASEASNRIGSANWPK